MKWSSTIAASVAALSVLLAAYPATAKKDTTTALNDKVHELISQTAKRSVFRLNGNKFRDYVRNSPRNYSMVVIGHVYRHERSAPMRHL